jgi:hypothetical protein
LKADLLKNATSFSDETAQSEVTLLDIGSDPQFRVVLWSCFVAINVIILAMVLLPKCTCPTRRVGIILRNVAAIVYVTSSVTLVALLGVDEGPASYTTSKQDCWNLLVAIGLYMCHGFWAWPCLLKYVASQIRYQPSINQSRYPIIQAYPNTPRRYFNNTNEQSRSRSPRPTTTQCCKRVERLGEHLVLTSRFLSRQCSTLLNKTRRCSKTLAVPLLLSKITRVDVRFRQIEALPTLFWRQLHHASVHCVHSAERPSGMRKIMFSSGILSSRSSAVRARY